MDQILGNLSLLVEFPIVNLKIVLDGIMIGALFALPPTASRWCGA